MSDKFECIYYGKVDNCNKSWPKKPSKREVIVHGFDDHNANLQFLPDEDIFKMVVEREMDFRARANDMISTFVRRRSEISDEENLEILRDEIISSLKIAEKRGQKDETP